MITMRAKTDTLGPALSRALKQFPDRRPFLEAAGLLVVAAGKRSFNESDLRPAVWPARKSGGKHPLLKLSGTLWRSIAIKGLTNHSVTVGSDRVYAAIHQFGGTILPKKPGGRLAFKIGGQTVFARKVTVPARPFLPFLPSGELLPKVKADVQTLLREKVLRALG